MVCFDGRFDQVSENIRHVRDDAEDGDSNFDIYATGTGVIGLLLIFGLFGRKRSESFLDAERRKMRGEGSMWDKN